MRAQRDNHDLLILRAVDHEGKEIRVPNSPRFTEFVGSFGWPDMTRQEHYAQTWFVVVGEQEDGKLCVFAEFGGDLGEVAAAARDWKDRLMIERMLIDPMEEASFRFLTDFEGLTHYDICDYSSFGSPVFTYPSTEYPQFRDRDTICSVVPVVDRIRANPRAGFDTILTLNRRRQLVVLAECPRAQWALHEKPTLRETVEHPITKALVWAVCTLAGEQGHDTNSTGGNERWYKNIR